MCIWFPCHMRHFKVLLNVYKIKIKKWNRFRFNYIHIQIVETHTACTLLYEHRFRYYFDVFCYYLERRHCCWPRHKRGTQFQNTPRYDYIQTEATYWGWLLSCTVYSRRLLCYRHSVDCRRHRSSRHQRRSETGPGHCHHARQVRGKRGEFQKHYLQGGPGRCTEVLGNKTLTCNCVKVKKEPQTTKSLTLKNVHCVSKLRNAVAGVHYLWLPSQG